MDGIKLKLENYLLNHVNRIYEVIQFFYNKNGKYGQDCHCIDILTSQLETFGYQDEVNHPVVVNLPIKPFRGIPGCSSRQLVGVKIVSKGETMDLQTLGVFILCRLSLRCQIFLLSLLSVGMRQGLLLHCFEQQILHQWQEKTVVERYSESMQA